MNNNINKYTTTYESISCEDEEEQQQLVENLHVSVDAHSSRWKRLAIMGGVFIFASLLMLEFHTDGEHPYYGDVFGKGLALMGHKHEDKHHHEHHDHKDKDHHEHHEHHEHKDKHTHSHDHETKHGSKHDHKDKHIHKDMHDYGDKHVKNDNSGKHIDYDDGDKYDSEDKAVDDAAAATASRVLEDESYLDVAMPCTEAYFTPIFHSYIDLQHAVDAAKNVKKVGKNTFEIKYGDLSVTFYITYDDNDMKADMVIVKGWDLFNTYREHYDFVSLPTDIDAGRRVQGDDREALTEGCRLVRTFYAIMPEYGLTTIDKWIDANDPEMIVYRDAMEAQAGNETST